MTDLEISKALALAIGWKEEQIHKNLFIDVLQVTVRNNGEWAVMQAFDYRDWNVIGPIAEKFDCFPMLSEHGPDAGKWFYFDIDNGDCFHADTPQKAIALAVIGAKR